MTPKIWSTLTTTTTSSHHENQVGTGDAKNGRARLVVTILIGVLSAAAVITFQQGSALAGQGCTGKNMCIARTTDKYGTPWPHYDFASDDPNFSNNGIYNDNVSVNDHVGYVRNYNPAWSSAAVYEHDTYRGGMFGCAKYKGERWKATSNRKASSIHHWTRYTCGR